MRVAADHEPLGDAADDLAQHVLGRDPGEDLIVAPGRAVAEQHAVERQRDRPRGERIPPAPVELAPAPRRRPPGSIVGNGRAVVGRRGFALAVTGDPVHGLGPGVEQLEAPSHARSADGIAGHDDGVRPHLVEVGEYGSERGQVPVDGGDNGDAHRPNSTM
jgi:hypothetical protein